jgi:hypothetical protein
MRPIIVSALFQIIVLDGTSRVYDIACPNDSGLQSKQTLAIAVATGAASCGRSHVAREYQLVGSSGTGIVSMAPHRSQR